MTGALLVWLTICIILVTALVIIELFFDAGSD